jgi:hypothetical protein
LAANKREPGSAREPGQTVLAAGTFPPVREDLSQALASLPPEGVLSGDAARAAQRLRDRITRDLLPRLAGPHPTLIVGIAGPNNVGKSSLFNSLVGAPLSPSRPEGGLTKQCFAAAHPTLWTGPLRAFLEARYEVVEAEGPQPPPITELGPPGRLYLARVPSVPEGLLVMDTPDFDSVHLTNRRAAEALLVTVDVVIFVVSRHTYQNAAVVQFLKDAVGHGRPYALVYNEAMREDVAVSHLDKLVSDVGHPPLSREVALHQPQVESGEALLKTSPLGQRPSLSQLLREPAQVARLKASALRAALGDALEELREVAAALESAVAEPERLRARVRRELLQVAERAAVLSIPADVLIEAFRDELDARSPTHRWLRRVPRLLAAGLSQVGRFVRTQFVGPEPVVPALQTRVRQALVAGVREVALALAPEVATWRGKAGTGEVLSSTLAAATAPEGIAVPAEPETHGDRQALYAFCRELLAQHMPAGVSGELRQLGATFAYAVPALAGAMGALVVPGITGGADVIFASTLVTTPLLEKFVDLLGADVRDAVAQAWRTSRGQTLARELETGAFAPLLGALDDEAQDARRRADRLRATAETVTRFIAEQPR